MRLRDVSFRSIHSYCAALKVSSLLAMVKRAGALAPRLAWLKIPEDILGDKSEGVPPVPIPNTAVKPFSGDGTATSRGGRVTRRQD